MRGKLGVGWIPPQVRLILKLSKCQFLLLLLLKPLESFLAPSFLFHPTSNQSRNSFGSAFKVSPESDSFWSPPPLLPGPGHCYLSFGLQYQPTRLFLCSTALVPSVFSYYLPPFLPRSHVATTLNSCISNPLLCSASNSTHSLFPSLSGSVDTAQLHSLLRVSQGSVKVLTGCCSYLKAQRKKSSLPSSPGSLAGFISWQLQNSWQFASSKPVTETVCATSSL